MKIEGFVLTTAAHLFNPERAYQVAGDAKWGVEVYPTPPKFWSKGINKAASLLVGSKALIPTIIDTNSIQSWEEKYGSKTERIHLPWWYNNSEAMRELFFGHVFRLPPRLRTAFLLAGATYLMGTNSNEHGITLAQDLGVGITVHTNVLRGFCKAGKIPSLMERVPFVLLEDTRIQAVVQQARGKYKLDGLLLAVDHLFDEATRLYPDKESPSRIVRQVIKSFENRDVLRQTKAMHLSLPAHRLIELGEANTELLVRSIVEKDWDHPISLALDYNLHLSME